MATNFEFQIGRALGDWMNAENPRPRCARCHGFHEEPLLMLMALTGWDCTRAQKYHTEVFDRCLDGAVPFAVKYRRFRRLAPHWRIGGHLGQESDADYLARIRQLKQSKCDFELLLHSEARKRAGIPESKPRRVGRGQKNSQAAQAAVRTHKPKAGARTR